MDISYRVEALFNSLFEVNRMTFAPMSAAVVAFIAASGIAHAQPRVAVERLWTGIYSVSQSRIVDDAGVSFGQRSIAEDPKLEFETTRVTARTGTRFGIGFIFRGGEGQTVTYRVVWRYPAGGITDPRVGKTFHGDVTVETAILGKPLFQGHVFGYDWELVPGDYIVEIWVEDQKLIEQGFRVFLP